MGFFSSIFGGGGSAKRAAANISSGYRHAEELLADQQATTREDFNPYMEAGTTALDQYMAAIGGDASGFKTSPGYQFRMDEGQKAIERQASARKGLVSGRTSKELARYSQDYASSEYNNWLNQVLQPVNLGFNATNALANYDYNYANQRAGYEAAIGGADASGILGKAAQLSNAGASWMNLGASLLGGQGSFSGTPSQPVSTGTNQLGAYDPNLPWKQGSAQTSSAVQRGSSFGGSGGMADMASMFMMG